MEEIHKTLNFMSKELSRMATQPTTPMMLMNQLKQRTMGQNESNVELQSANTAEWIHSQRGQSNGNQSRPLTSPTCVELLFYMPFLFVLTSSFCHLSPLLLQANILLFYILSYFFSLTTALALPLPSVQTLPPSPPSLAIVECWNSRRESEEVRLGLTA